MIGTLSHACTISLLTYTHTHTHIVYYHMHFHLVTTDTPFFPLGELTVTTRKSEYLSSAHPACLVVHGVI